MRVPAGTQTNGDVVPARHVGDQRLRAVAAGHADHVGAARDRVLGERPQVVARAQHDRLDAARRAASSTRSNCSTLPPPDRGFISSTPCCAGPTFRLSEHRRGEVMGEREPSGRR